MSFRIYPRDTEIRFMSKFGGNRQLRSCRKVVWITTQKNSRSAGLTTAPILPKMRRSRPKLPERCRPLTYPCMMYTDFGPDQLRFAGLIPERLIISAQKVNII